MLWLNSLNGQRILESYSHGMGRLRINLSNLKSVPLPLPPAKEQEVIASLYDQLFIYTQELVSVISLQIHRSYSLRQSVLNAAFEGKLVRQDSNDEPASVLLARIRAENADQPKRKRARRISKSHQDETTGFLKFEG